MLTGLYHQGGCNLLKFNLLLLSTTSNHHHIIPHHENPTYRYFCLAKRWRNVQVLRNVDMPKVVPIFDAPHGQPIDVVYGQVTGQLNLNIFALVASQWFQRAHLIRNFDTHDVRFGAIAHPKVRIRPGPVVVEVWDVECFCVQNADVTRAEPMGEPFEFRQYTWLRYVQARWDEYFTEIDLE